MSQYTDMTWQAVKKLVLANGGEWSNNKAGIAYLESLEAKTAAPVEDAKPLGWDNHTEAKPAEPAPVAETEDADIAAAGFNPDEAYGTVHGTDTNGAKYHQNGQYYGNDGQIVKF